MVTIQATGVAMETIGPG